MIVDLKEYLRKSRRGRRVKINGKRMYSLTYADDMVILAEDEVAMDAERNGKMSGGKKA